MGSEAYVKRFEDILGRDLLGELGEDEKLELIAELLVEIWRILESPIHLQNLESQEEEDLLFLYSKIVRSVNDDSV